MFLVLIFFWYSKSTFAKTTFFISSIKVWNDSYMFLNVSQMEQLLIVLQIGLLMSWACKKVQLGLLVCRFSNWIISKSIGLTFFDKIFIDMSLVKFGLDVKMSCCLFDQFFIRHIDGKYRSLTASLVDTFVVSECGDRSKTKNYECTSESWNVFFNALTKEIQQKDLEWLWTSISIKTTYFSAKSVHTDYKIKEDVFEMLFSMFQVQRERIYRF